MRKTHLIILFSLFGFLCLTCHAQETHITPTPQQVDTQSGHFIWDDNVILTYDASDAEICQIVDLLRKDMEQISPKSKPFARGIIKDKHFVELSKTDHIDAPENKDQAYKLTISKSYIRIEATTSTGLFYGTQSLKQIYRWASQNAGKDGIKIQCMNILDWPNLKLRGWMDDISRGPIVTVDYLKTLIPQMAECKLNFFTLYTEHTFKTQCHPDIAPFDAFTAEEIKDLENFCKPYHMQIIGNQQCFAHFEKTLSNPFYSDLADTKYNLNPAINKTYTFLEDHLKEVAKAYKSPYFNINCDETESLGKGYAKELVDTIGASTIYYLHVNRVNQMLKNSRKRAMMWGDIAASHPEIIENLDDDLILIAWTYGARDNYNEFLRPYVNSGHSFMVASGTSMWGTVWPDMENAKGNIRQLCADGYRNGAFGMMNTCWDDWGESLINSVLYSLVYGAECSWNTHSNPDFDHQFCLHYLGCSTELITQSLWNLNQISKESSLSSFQSLTEDMLPFYPSLVSDSTKQENEKYVDELKEIIPQIEAAKKKAKCNTTLFDNALYSANRMLWCANRNIVRCQLYKTYQDTTKTNANESKEKIDELISSLHSLKQEYLNIWNIESRNYWLDVNMKKYDDIARELQQLEFMPIIDSETDSEGNFYVSIKTLFGNKEIHFTTDGKEVDKGDEVYSEPIIISQSCIVKAKCFDVLDNGIGSEKYFLCHKGLGKLKQLNSVAGNHRPEYSGGGDNALLDGNLGSNNYKDGRWQGFYGTDADIELDFAKIDSIQALKIGFMVNAYDWILRPNEIDVYTSTNGKDFKIYKTFEIQTNVEEGGNFMFRERFATPNLSTRYLKIVVKNPGLIPEGLPGSGYESWIFMDEIIVE